MGYTVVALGPDTWDGFADLVERNNGIFGGCWCIGFHLDRGDDVASHREAKVDRVRSGRLELFEDLGFAPVRQVGKHAWVLSRTVAASSRQ
ncbi:hypothetical protein Q9R29_14410 [Rothia sp. ARF10]|nr:hypothetical protein [Rothia sp. ARF10]